MNQEKTLEEKLRELSLDDLNKITIKRIVCTSIFEEARHRPDVKAKISAAMKDRVWSDEHKEKVSNSLKSYYIQNGTRALSDEHKAKTSAALKGRVFSDETKAKISAANTGKKWGDNMRAKICKLTEADVLKIRSDWEKHTGTRLSFGNEAAKHYGVSFPTICGILSRRNWNHI